MIATMDDVLMQTAQSTMEWLNFAGLEARDAGKLLRSMRRERPDLLILDDKLPGEGGIALCGTLRGDPFTAELPIIMISAEGDGEARQIAALDSGADDCLPRPVHADMLAARIRALTRRMPPAKPGAHLHAGPIVMDLERWLLKVEGMTVDLTYKEFRLLQVLLEARGRALTRDVLVQMVWAHDTPLVLESRTVDVHIGRLRRKLGSSLGRHIITVRNVGFRFELQPEWLAGIRPHAAQSLGAE
jgi:DNA-binding response OmpR family regulator